MNFSQGQSPQQQKLKIDGATSTSHTKPLSTSNSKSLSKNGLSSGQVDAPDQSGEALKKLGNKLEDVSSLAGFNQVVGKFFDGIVPGEGTTIEGDVAVLIKLPNVAELEVRLDFSLLRSKSDLWLQLSASFMVSKVIDLYLTEIKAGLYIQAGLQAKGDSGQELMDLVSLAMLPKVQRKSSKLTEALYGDSRSFEKRVVSAMDPKGTDEADWITSSLNYGAFGGFKTYSPGAVKETEGSMAIGYKAQDTIEKGADGDRKLSSKSGLFIDMSFKYAGTSWQFTLDEASDSVELSGAVTLKRCDKAALDSYLAGAVTSAANVIEMARTELAAKKDPRSKKTETQLADAMALLRNKTAATAATTVAAFQPMSVSVEMKTLIVLGKKSSVSVTVANVISHEASLLKSKLEGNLKLGQRILHVPF